MVSRSPKLPSPPNSRRESTFTGQMPLDRTQADYFGHLHGHGGWLDSQNVQGRSNLGNGVRSFQGPMGNLSHSIAGTLDPFSTDLSIPSSQLNYTTGYVPTHGTAPREFWSFLIDRGCCFLISSAYTHYVLSKSMSLYIVLCLSSIMGIHKRGEKLIPIMGLWVYEDTWDIVNEKGGIRIIKKRKHEKPKKTKNITLNFWFSNLEH
jgi:hypothetical protein